MTDNKVQSVKHLSAKTVEVTLDRFKPGRVYQLDLEELKSKDGDEIQNRLFYYTANHFPKLCPELKKDGRNFSSKITPSRSSFPLRSRISQLPFLGFATTRGKGLAAGNCWYC